MSTNLQMKFCSVPRGTVTKEVPLTAYLIDDDWDDWNEFETVFSLRLYDQQGARHDLGQLKIGILNMPKGLRRPKLQGSFNELPSGYFSLGQDSSYYEKLYSLDASIRTAVLNSLKDVVDDDVLLKEALEQRVMKISLLRFVSLSSINGQFRRILKGGLRVTKYRFSYTAASSKAQSIEPLKLTFNVEPESSPPSNIHVLIGRNGVGKTHLLTNMSRALVEKETKQTQVGAFEYSNNPSAQPFCNLVSVTFSAFDPFLPLAEQKDKSSVWLRRSI